MADISAPIKLFDVFTEWRIDWFSLLLVTTLGAAYLRVRLAGARRGLQWPLRRDVTVALGLLFALWTTCGMPQARSGQLMWVWTSQQLLLLLVVPVVVLAGQPLSLVRAVGGPNSGLLRMLDSRPVRVLGHPFLGPLLVPVIAGLLFFGGVGALALRSAPDGWALHLLLLGLGALIAIPLVDRDDTRPSLAVGLALAVGLLELMFDAFPGIILTFQHHLTLAAFSIDRPVWAGTALGDQHLSGGILWAVAEVLDVPFLVLATTRWLRADAREATRVDGELDAVPAVSDAPAAPWWEDHPELRERFRR